MSTKTLTIMEDAYKLLIDNKLEKESFSEEIRRIILKKNKKKLIDFFGILSKRRDSMMNDFKRIRKEEIKLTKERLARLNLK